MKLTWFHHLECSSEEADQLLADYQRRGVKVERSLNADFLTWTVSARLPESAHAPRASRHWQNRMWR